MNQRSTGLIEPLFYWLVEQDLNHFTVTDLRDAYLQRVSQGSVDSVEARRVVYTQILRLLKHGLLEKEPTDHPYNTRYSKTVAFYSTRFHSKAMKGVPKPIADTTPNSPAVDETVVVVLNTKLQTYRAELLTAIGESEEYQQLLKEFPQHQQVLSQKYEQTRDITTRLLGKVKAIEQLLACKQVGCA